MSKTFQPELGQICLSNSEWRELPLDPAVEEFLLALGEKIADRELTYAYPTDNSGASYGNEIFAMRAYCWCDGELHPDGCPPNFEHGDFAVSWYKHAGRGASQNREVSTEELEEMRRACFASLPVGNPGALARRAAALRKGPRVCKCGQAPAWTLLPRSGPPTTSCTARTSTATRRRSRAFRST